MEETPTTSTTTEAPAHEAAHSPGIMDVSGTMMGLTWLTFILMTVILYKVAWKPILSALNKREDDIRNAIENAEKTRQELAQIEQTRQQIISQADSKAKEIVESARKAAIEAANVIDKKAKDDAQILLENAQREIRAAYEKAVASMKKESADLAISLARKIIGDNLDEARQRELTGKLIREI